MSFHLFVSSLISFIRVLVFSANRSYVSLGTLVPSTTGQAVVSVIRLACCLIVVSICLPSDALAQCLPSYLGFSYLGCGVSLHGCSSKAQPLLITLDEVAPPDLERGVAPLGPPAAWVALVPYIGLAKKVIHVFL